MYYVQDILYSTKIAMKEKLLLPCNMVKKPLTNIEDMFKRASNELKELSDEIFSKNKDYIKIRKEAADCCNFCGMIIELCDRVLEGQNDTNMDES